MRTIIIDFIEKQRGWGKSSSKSSESSKHNSHPRLFGVKSYKYFIKNPPKVVDISSR